MKLINKIIFTGLLFLMVSCSPQLEEGSVVLNTPQFIMTPNFNVLDGSSAPVVTNDQNRYRYEIVINAFNKRIAFIQLKRNERKVISVPTGIPLDFHVGVYYAKNSESFDEQYNVYLASDSLKGVQLMSGESRELNFTLDMSQSVRVNSYYTPQFGINSFTGGIVAGDNNPYFSYRNNSSVPGTSAVMYNAVGGVFTDRTAALIQGDAGNGILTTVKGAPTVNKYWYVSKTSIRTDADGIPSGTDYAQDVLDVSGYESYFDRMKEVKSFYFPGLDRGYYFFNYNNGYLSLEYDGNNGGWSNFGNIQINAFNHVYPQEPFLMDMEQDELKDFAFFASKIGTYYLASSTLKHFPNKEYDAGVNEFRKLIRIQNPRDLASSLMIRKVKTIGNTIYLGTRQGVFSINKLSSEWKKFSTDPTTDYAVFPVDKIKKEAGFENEMVVSIDQSDVSGLGTILVVSTPKRVIFKNLSNGKSDEITVWDGLPFTPLSKVPNSAQTNTIDFIVHETAEINFVLWNQNTSRFWIGTNYGLGSVHLSRLKL